MRTDFYASQSVYSEPGPHRESLIGGGGSPGSMARWIGSFLQHPRGAESRQRGFTAEQAADLELRCVAQMLCVAVDRGLLEGDGSQVKVGGLCRDFALLAASGFRARGIPARLRVGFADYIVAGFWEDHWICEWHDGRRWVRLDVEFAADGRASFDPLDVPGERFLTASEAWFRIRDEPGIASRFGVSSLGLGGEWFVAGSLFREYAALCKLELKPWDYWGLAEHLPRISTEWPQQARATLDQLAAWLKRMDVDGKGEPDGLADWPLPTQVTSFPHGEPVLVVLKTA